MEDYLQKILRARVYDVAEETPLEKAKNLSKKQKLAILLKLKILKSRKIPKSTTFLILEIPKLERILILVQVPLHVTMMVLKNIAPKLVTMFSLGQTLL